MQTMCTELGQNILSATANATFTATAAAAAADDEDEDDDVFFLLSFFMKQIPMRTHAK